MPLTGLPDALWCREGITEDAFVPEASKTMDDLSSLIQNHTLHFILTVIRGPVARLQYTDERVTVVGRAEVKVNYLDL